jgi:hypothetical protein
MGQHKEVSMRKLILVSVLLAPTLAVAQTQNAQGPFSYNIAELRLVDADSDGDGLALKGSFALDENWLVLGGLRNVDFDNGVDSQLLEIGAGYVWHYRQGLDLIGAIKYLDIDVDTPFGGGDDSGLGLSGGLRAWLSPVFEWRGSINHQSFDDSDTYLELAGDYYLNDQISVGVSLEFAGDLDMLTIGGRWFLR